CRPSCSVPRSARSPWSVSSPPRESSCPSCSCSRPSVTAPCARPERTRKNRTRKARAPQATTRTDVATPEQLFTEIFEANHRAVHAYLLGRVGDRELARDLVQETFLRVWRRLDEVAALPSERRQAWIFTVARNLA